MKKQWNKQRSAMEKRVLLEKRGRESNQVRSFCYHYRNRDYFIEYMGETRSCCIQSHPFDISHQHKWENPFAVQYFRQFKVRENWIINKSRKKNALDITCYREICFSSDLPQDSTSVICYLSFTNRLVSNHLHISWKFECVAKYSATLSL